MIDNVLMPYRSHTAPYPQRSENAPRELLETVELTLVADNKAPKYRRTAAATAIAAR